MPNIRPVSAITRSCWAAFCSNKQAESDNTVMRIMKPGIVGLTEGAFLNGQLQSRGRRACIRCEVFARTVACSDDRTRCGLDPHCRPLHRSVHGQNPLRSSSSLYSGRCTPWHILINLGARLRCQCRPLNLHAKVLISARKLWGQSDLRQLLQAADTG
jgi:hypothetical protein